MSFLCMLTINIYYYMEKINPNDNKILLISFGYLYDFEDGINTDKDIINEIDKTIGGKRKKYTKRKYRNKRKNTRKSKN